MRETTMTRVWTLVGLVTLSSATASWAAPGTINFTGRLSTSAGRVTGPVAITFRLYATPTGGSPLWTEAHDAVAADDGLVLVDLGTKTPLEASVVAGDSLYLEVSVGAETLSPRMTIGSVPFAMRAQTCDALGGAVKAADVITSLTGGTGVTATRSGNSVTMSIDPAAFSLLGQDNTFTGANTFSSAGNSFTGTGAGLVSLNASNVSSGTLAVARGGTNATTVGSSGSIAFSTGTQYGFTDAGTAGQVLGSAGAGAPTWIDLPVIAARGHTFSNIAFTSTTPLQVVQATFTPPSSGYVIASLSASCSVSTSAGLLSAYALGITTFASGTSQQYNEGRVAFYGTGTGVDDRTVSANAVIPVSKVLTNIYVFGRKINASSPNPNCDGTLLLTYVPRQL